MKEISPANQPMEPHIPDTSGTVFASGIRFQCRRCGACCTGDPGLIRVTREEVRHIARHLECTDEEILSQYIRITPEGLSILEKPDGACQFFENSGCRIYRVRPLSCRAFPFWLSTLRSCEAWEKTRCSCPGIGSGTFHSPEEILEWIRLRLEDYPDAFYESLRG